MYEWGWQKYIALYIACSVLHVFEQYFAAQTTPREWVHGHSFSLAKSSFVIKCVSSDYTLVAHWLKWANFSPVDKFHAIVWFSLVTLARRCLR